MEDKYDFETITASTISSPFSGSIIEVLKFMIMSIRNTIFIRESIVLLVGELKSSGSYVISIGIVKA